jgi:hypothetical protein
MAPSKPGLTCPSAECAPGATLLGTLGADGRIKHLRTPLTVDAPFVAAVTRDGPAETHMRFAAPCQEGRCQQWTGSACGVIERVLAHLDTRAPDLRAAAPPPCTIRATCRWYAERADAACLACDLVVMRQDQAAAG